MWYSYVPPVMSVSVMLHIQVFSFQTVSLFQELKWYFAQIQQSLEPPVVKSYNTNSEAAYALSAGGLAGSI